MTQYENDSNMAGARAAMTRPPFSQGTAIEGVGKVYAAINAVQAALAKEGIAKSRRNQQQGYAFRGIDEVYKALSPLLAEHKLVVIPRVLNRTVTERETQRGGVLFYVVVQVAFDFVSAEDGSTHTALTFGEAMDSADKATNKAMSAAYKYAALQTFAIPTEGEGHDADETTPDPAPRKRKAEPFEPTPAYFDLVGELEGTTTKEELKRWAEQTTDRRHALTPGEQAKLRELTVEHQNTIKRGGEVPKGDGAA